MLKAICGDMWISDHYKQGGQGFSLDILFIDFFWGVLGKRDLLGGGEGLVGALNCRGSICIQSVRTDWKSITWLSTSLPP